MTALLAAAGLRAYYGASQILHGIDLAVRRGETVALMGRNGMGKTTLLRSLIGLVADRRGRILLGDRDVTTAPPEAIARAGVAFVPEGRGVFGSLSVVENLVMAARPGTDGRRRWGLERVFELFPRLHERERQKAGTMSGGEQQMLAIGRALMAQPRLLLLDEPSMGISPILTERIYDTIAEINRQGTTILLVEQNANFALGVSQRGYVLETGKVVLSNHSAALKEDPEVQKAYLGG
jgi:branched-chain amino acid transport system ATP-binding protein